MKSLFLKIFIMCLTMLSMSLVITACNQQETSTSTTPAITDAEKQQQWEDRGIYNADTVEEAAGVAGYQIATPSFTPEGFSRSSKIILTRLGGGLPESMKPKFIQIDVEQMWSWDNDYSVFFDLIQSKHNFSINGEPTEICGQTGKRKLTLATDEMPAKLTLAWSDGDLFYAITATLTGPLDETVINQIACSVSAH